ncbi:hypothetical protein ACK3TF_000514 [Chlorella vulgaris]
MPQLKIGPFYLGKPDADDRGAVESAARVLPFNFPHVGVTRTAPPLPEDVAAEGWTVDHNRVMVGRGRAAYGKARRLLEEWRHFDLGWACVNAPTVKPGAPVVVTALSLFCWTCNPLRISYVEECALRRGSKQQLPPWSGAPPAAAAGARLQEQWLQTLRGVLPGRPSGDQTQPQAAAVAAARPPRGRRYAFAHTTLGGHQISGEERFTVAWNAEDDTVWYEIYTLSRPGTLVASAAHPVLRAFQRKFAADSCDAMQREMAAGAGSGK